MSAWRPDDSLLDRNKDGELVGTLRIKDALRKRGIDTANRVITSQDEDIRAVERDLAGVQQPAGVRRSQMPITLGEGEDVLCFETQMNADASVPEHQHGHSVFRVVISGSLLFRGKTLGPGEWIVVPAGQDYSVAAGPEGCVMFYAHWPWPPK